MKKKLFVLAAVIMLFAAFSFASVPVGVSKTTKAVAAENPAEVSVETRFLNMLNHNFVYGEDFGSFDAIATGSVLSMLSARDGDYIAENYVKSFASDMYGIKLTNFDEGSIFRKEGYVHIPAMGYTKFTHSNISVSSNEDGTFTVLTDVVIDAHDDEPYTATAVSLFAPNKNSSFGYIIVYSNINTRSVSF